MSRRPPAELMVMPVAQEKDRFVVIEEWQGIRALTLPFRSLERNTPEEARGAVGRLVTQVLKLGEPENVDLFEVTAQERDYPQLPRYFAFARGLHAPIFPGCEGMAAAAYLRSIKNIEPRGVYPEVHLAFTKAIARTSVDALKFWIGSGQSSIRFPDDLAPHLAPFMQRI